MAWPRGGEMRHPPNQGAKQDSYVYHRRPELDLLLCFICNSVQEFTSKFYCLAYWTN